MPSIFSNYAQDENRVTGTIINVLRNLPLTVVEAFLTMLTEEEDRAFVGFRLQPKSEATGRVPDAEIGASFRVLLETKGVRDKINREQLKGHWKNLSAGEAGGPRLKRLVYLTPDRAEPGNLTEFRATKGEAGAALIWKSFADVQGLIDELLSGDLDLSERDRFLLRSLSLYLTDAGLIPEQDPTVIVAAKTAWPEYLEYGLYLCQPERSFRQIDWLGFYADGAVQPQIAKVLAQGGDITFPDGLDGLEGRFRQKLKAWFAAHPGAAGETRRVFDLSLPDAAETVTLNAPIPNDLRSDSGRTAAFTQGQRYVALERLRSSRTTRDLVRAHSGG